MNRDPLANISWHSDYKEIGQLIAKNGFPLLYHFTDIRNLTSIGIHGLFTKEDIEKSDFLERVFFGGNELSKSLDIRYGNWDKVSLSWLPEMPMAYKRETEFHVCYLIFNASLALAENVVFTDMNATDAGHKREKGMAGLSLVNFRAVRSRYPYPNTLVKKQKQAEILVPFSIPPELIRAVAFRSEASLQYGRKICKKDSPDFTKKFVVDDRIFHLPAPYVNRYSISPVSRVDINKNRLENWFFTNKLNFTINEDACIILEIKNLTPGVGVTVIFGSAELFAENAIKGGSTIWTYTELPTSSPGRYIVEVLIDDKENSITQFFETIEVS